MKQWLRDIFYSEFPADTDAVVSARILMFNIFLLVFLGTALSFAVFHAFRGAYGQALVLLAASAVLIGEREYIRITRNHRRGLIIAVFSTLPVFFMNYITGGVDNCGPLWHYCFPMVALLLLGPFMGSVAAITLLTGCLLLLVEPFADIMRATYSPDFLFRFFISYVIVYFLGFVYEFQKYRTGKKIELLSGLLPICASCKKIRDDRGYWNQIEAYISEHSKAEFSHSICPDCARKLYPDLEL